MTTTIDIGPADRVSQLYSYPNTPGNSHTLEQTVRHWFGLTVDRDGFTKQGATCSVTVDGSNEVHVTLDGPPAIQAALAAYADRLPTFLANGWNALTKDVAAVKAAGAWDPSPDPEPPPYRPWRFFLPHGMAMLNQKSLQFFHYPPIRLLEGTKDYLNDPVPARCYENLQANGVAEPDLPLFNTVVDATPIAAADDQGSKAGGDKEWGLIPIQYFHDYQRAQVALLLNSSAAHPGYTVPIVVYGAHPRATFEALYDVKIGVNVCTVAEVIPGKKTAVIGANHPYVFYAAAQGFDTVGLGHFLSAQDCQQATGVMVKDLIVCRWQKEMADDPSGDPHAVLQAATAYWNDPAQAAQVCALVRHQASLYYASPTSLKYQFNTSLADAATQCAAHANQPCAGVTPATSPQGT